YISPRLSVAATRQIRLLATAIDPRRLDEFRPGEQVGGVGTFRTSIRKRASHASRKGETAKAVVAAAPAPSRRGRLRPLLDEGEQARLRELAAARPHATIAELREAFASATGRTDSARRVGRELKKLGIKRTRVPPAAGAATPPKPRRYGYMARHRWTGSPGA